ncbi:MAG: peptidoglycan editing factor PgeF [Dyadobacter sp.]|uniref:peptidoglycan editing factor PgeF n=1 Tax=Dyadobacter sp. TaxID=1914288 RepID=UPI003262E63D
MAHQNLLLEQPLFRSPSIFSGYPGLVAAESTRHGGVSTAPYHSLNLGGSTQDSPEHVAENNRRFFDALNVPLHQVAKSHQVHGTDILTVTASGRFEGYDALITNLPDVQLAVTVADCTPILIYDPTEKAMAAIHAGWRGTAGQIVKKTVEAMEKAFGTKAEDCLAYIGTCIDECSFEVGDDVAQHFDPTHKRWDAEKEKFFVDLKLANKHQLLFAGLKPDNVEVSNYSTVLHNEDYFSYRHEKGLTGRMLATIGIVNL